MTMPRTGNSAPSRNHSDNELPLIRPISPAPMPQKTAKTT